MSELPHNRYRVEHIRMQHWNYAWKGHYFVTIMTRNGITYFGKIQNAKMRLNVLGEILEREWLATPGLRLDMNIRLGEFVIMPNHFHGIISVGRNAYNGFDGDGEEGHVVRTHCNASPQHHDCIASPQPLAVQNQFGPQSKNLAAIIRGLKGAVTKQARQINPEFGWQSRFHDRLIRDPVAYDQIAKYIRDNPKKWWDNESKKELWGRIAMRPHSITIAMRPHDRRYYDSSQHHGSRSGSAGPPVSPNNSSST